VSQDKRDHIGVAHHFGGGVYMKEITVPAGLVVGQHVHKYDHLSYLVSGEAVVDAPFSRSTLHGPSGMVIEAGRAHSIRAVTDCVWLCIHATDCTDADEVDAGLIK